MTNENSDEVQQARELLRKKELEAEQACAEALQKVLDEHGFALGARGEFVWQHGEGKVKCNVVLVRKAVP